jgi:hypothetical protein
VIELEPIPRPWFLAGRLPKSWPIGSSRSGSTRRAGFRQHDGLPQDLGHFFNLAMQPSEMLLRPVVASLRMLPWPVF